MAQPDDRDYNPHLQPDRAKNIFLTTEGEYVGHLGVIIHFHGSDFD